MKNKPITVWRMNTMWGSLISEYHSEGFSSEEDMLKEAKSFSGIKKKKNETLSDYCDRINNLNDDLDIELFSEEIKPEFEYDPDAFDGPSQAFLNLYICPACAHRWSDVYECMVDDDCLQCGERHISPIESQ